MFISIADTSGTPNYLNVDYIVKVKDRADGGCEITLVGDVNVYTPASAQSVMDQIHRKTG